MTSLGHIVQFVGPDKWRRASDEAMTFPELPPSDGNRGKVDQSRFDMIPHEIEHLIWDGSAAWEEKFRLFRDVYREFPSYGHLMYLNFHVPEFPVALRQVLWDWTKECLLERGSARANWVAYWLWCDVFEAGHARERIALAAEAFQELTGPRAQPAVLRAVLENSGPVSFELKARLYDRLIDDPDWHPWIFESLLRSAGDVYGLLDAREARRYVARLSMPSRAKEVKEFHRALASPVKKEFPQTLADAIRKEGQREGSGGI